MRRTRRHQLNQSDFKKYLSDDEVKGKIATSRRIVLNRREVRWLLNTATARRVSLSGLIYEMTANEWHEQHPGTPKPHALRSSKDVKEWDTKLNAWANDLGGREDDYTRVNVLLRKSTWKELLLMVEKVRYIGLFENETPASLSEFVRDLIEKAITLEYSKTPEFYADIEKTKEIARELWGIPNPKPTPE